MKFSFQTFLIGFFILAFIGAILIFSGIVKIGKSSTQDNAVSVSVWGIYPQSIIQPYFDKINSRNKTISLNYLEKSESSLKSDLINALANGLGPNIVISDSANLISFRDKLYTIPFATYNERLFRDTYIDGASIFLNKDGVIAIPMLVDPLVVYYNKDLLAGANYVIPPSSWESLLSSLPKFVKKDSKGAIISTSIGLGESANVNHFKDILSALFLQTGNPIVTLNNNGVYESRLALGTSDSQTLPTAEALDFYTGFSNQATDRFSWSRTLPSTLDMFLSGKSAFYIGRASELFTIQSRNPNLNFDVTTMFQPKDAIRPITFGSFSGAGIIKSSPNFTASYTALGEITSKEFINYLSSNTALPSVRRDLLLAAQENPYVQAYFKSALSSFGWPDTDPQTTDEIFRAMIKSVNSGANTPIQAIYEASRNLQSISR